MPKTKIISAEDIAKRESRGAKIVREKQEVTITGLSGIMEQMQRATEAHVIAVEKQSTDTLEALNRLSEALGNFKGGETPDLGPFLQRITDLQKAGVPVPVEYRFDIERNSRNLMTSVTATPVPRVEH